MCVFWAKPVLCQCRPLRSCLLPNPFAPSLKQRFGDWIDARTAQGIETYGGPLTTDNGRDAERDMLEELLDFCQYQEQSRLELLADNARLRARIGVARERLGLPELEGYK